MTTQPDDDGRNPYGECESGHQMFRGGCPNCASDMVTQYEHFPKGTNK
jgi:hypothetical protein